MLRRRLRLSAALAASLLGHGCGDDAEAHGETPDGASTGDTTGAETGTTPGCDDGRTACDGVCVDLDDDREHCGACGQACDAGQVCSDGACGLTCGGTTPDPCGDGCFDLQTSDAHCGTCDTACGSGAACVDGACACSEGQSVCDDACVDTQTDVAHCGACDSPCDDGEVCSAGTCAASCDEGQSVCDGQCVDLQSDPLHCDVCGNACGDREACIDGYCMVPCEDPLSACSGTCVDQQADPSHCGDCTTTCAGEGAVGVCVDGGCDLACVDGRADCDDDYGTGCEVDTTTDNAHCGGCDTPCEGTCTAAGCVRHVFVTDAIVDGALGGLDGADALCQQEADAAGLDGTYLAWLSTTTTSPSERFVQSAVPYVRTDGTVIADDWADLIDGTLSAAIDLSASGLAPAAPVCPVDRVWTSTATDGTLNNATWTCSDWTQGQDASGHTGSFETTSGQWTSFFPTSCDTFSMCDDGEQTGSRLYCFQQ